MVDQISPTVSVAVGLSSAPLAAASPRPAPVKIPEAQPQGQSGPVSVEAAVGELNSHLQQANSELRFQQDTGSGRTVIKVVNPSTGEVVLQVPSDEVLAMSRRVREMENKMSASGALVDKEG